MNPLSDPHFLLTQGSAVLGVAALAASPLMPGRRGILWAQMVATVLFAAHFELSGLRAAAAVSLLGLVQVAVALAAPGNRRLAEIGWALVPAMAVTAVVLGNGPVSLLAGAAMGIIAIARMQSDERLLRGLLLVGCAVWLVHDVMVGAWVMVAGDLLSGAIGAAMLLRLLRPARHSAGPALPRAA